MKFEKYAVLIFSVLVLGCTSGGGSANFSQTSGAVINEFNFDLTNVEDYGDRAILTYGFQNVGGKTIDGTVEAFIFGPVLTSGNATGKTWNVENSGGGTVAKDRVSFSITNGTKFLPPDPQTGQPGMTQVYRIILVPPNQDEGMMNIPYSFEGELCYPYRTTTSSTIRSVAQNTYTTVTTKKSLAETRDSGGPIQLSLKAGETIRANAAGGSTILPIAFEVKDVGGGFATADTESCDPLIAKAKMGVIKVNVNVDGKAADCGTGDVYIRNGVGTLVCTGTFTNQNPKREYQIVAQTKYKYYVTQTATITVSDSKDVGDVDTA